jgi:MATE family multidrug resistance protein
MTVRAVITGSDPGSRTTWAVEAAATAKLALPITGALLAEMGTAVIDSIMAGRLGVAALGAATLGAQVLFTPQVLAMGAVGSVSALGAQAHGAEDHEMVGRVTRQGLRFATLLAFPVMAILALIPAMLRRCGYDPVIVDQLQGILWWGIAGVLPFLWFTVLRNFVTVLSRPMVVTFIALVALPITFFTNYAFMYGNWGAPNLGVASVGLAAAIFCWAQFLAIAVYVSRDRAIKAYRVFADLLHHDHRILADLFKVGWPIAAGYGFESGLFIASSLLIARFGQDTLAAHGAVMSVTSVSFMIPWAISQAGTVRVGYAVGAGRLAQARLAGQVAIAMGIAWMCCAACLMWFAPQFLTAFYLDLDDPANTAAILMAAKLFIVAAIFQIFDGTQVATAGVLRGYKDTRVPMMIMGLGYWVVGLGSGIPLAFLFGLAGPGLWWGMAMGLMASSTMLVIRFNLLSRRHIRLAVAGVSPGQ